MRAVPPGGLTLDLTLDLTATVADLRDALDRVAAWCQAAGVPAAAKAKVAIIIEELFSNTIKYGYRQECSRPVHVGLRCGPTLEIVYEDAAPPFDLVAAAATIQPNLSDDPDDHDVGGLGIALVLGLAASATYSRYDARNRLTLSLAAEPGSSR